MIDQWLCGRRRHSVPDDDIIQNVVLRAVFQVLLISA
jgi:hypothetical protein